VRKVWALRRLICWTSCWCAIRETASRQHRRLITITFGRTRCLLIQRRTLIHFSALTFFISGLFVVATDCPRTKRPTSSTDADGDNSRRHRRRGTPRQTSIRNGRPFIIIIIITVGAVARRLTENSSGTGPLLHRYRRHRRSWPRPRTATPSIDPLGKGLHRSGASHSQGRIDGAMARPRRHRRVAGSTVSIQNRGVTLRRTDGTETPRARIIILLIPAEPTTNATTITTTMIPTITTATITAAATTDTRTSATRLIIGIGQGAAAAMSRRDPHICPPGRRCRLEWDGAEEAGQMLVRAAAKAVVVVTVTVAAKRLRSSITGKVHDSRPSFLFVFDGCWSLLFFLSS
jgi:hypothetical protein